MFTQTHWNAFPSPVLSLPPFPSNTCTHTEGHKHAPPAPLFSWVISYVPINSHPSAATHLLQSVDFEQDLSPVALSS